MVLGYKAGKDRHKHNGVITSWPVRFRSHQGACHAQRVKIAAAKELQGFVQSETRSHAKRKHSVASEMTSGKKYRSWKRPWRGYEVNEMPQRPSYKS